MHLNYKPMMAAGLLGLSLFSSSLVLAQTAESSTEKAEAGKKENEVIAIVNEVEITRNTLDSVVEMIKRSTSGDQVDENSILEDLVATELARQEAKKSGLDEREDIKNKIQDFTDKLVLNAWMQEKASSFKFSDEDLKAVYDKRMEGTPKHEYKARHILVKEKAEAEAIIKELTDSKGDFAEMAKKKSTGPSGPMGGDLGWFKPDAMVPPFSEAVSSMEAGEISKAPVKTQFGWHIIKLEEKRDVKLPDFEKMKPQLKRVLEQEKMLEYMAGLRKDANVKIMLKEQKPAESAEDAEEDAAEEKKAAAE